MAKHLICTEPVYSGANRRWRRGKLVGRKALWNNRAGTNEFYRNMPLKVKIANKIHLMHDHGGSDAPQWKRAWGRLQKHITWFNFQRDWFQTL